MTSNHGTAAALCALPWPFTPRLSFQADKVVIAFILVVAAGACTCLGASLAFFAKLTNRKCLAASVAGAAGVMTCVESHLFEATVFIVYFTQQSR